MSIKYQYGYVNNNTIIDVTQLDDQSRKDKAPYYCISCGNELIPVLPKERKKHFKHKIDQNCSPETYLHKLAKQVFFDEYSHCLTNGLPFFYKFYTKFECNHFADKIDSICTTSQLARHNLTKVFDCIEMEKRADSFQPDIRLYSSTSDHQMFIEIAVTHKCEQEKIDSGIRIIEINIEKESDLQSIQEHFLTELDPIITTYNMQKRTLKGDFCKGKCKNFLQLIGVENWRQTAKSLTIRPENYGDKYKYFHVVGFTESANLDKRRYIDELRKLYFETGLAIKDCYLCQHHGYRPGNYVYCAKNKIFFYSNQATTCPDYLECSSVSSCVDSESRNTSQR